MSAINNAISDGIAQLIKKDEGCDLTVKSRINADGKTEIFVGYGHNVLPSDNLSIGDTISQQTAENLFNHDMVWTETGVRQLVKDYDMQPERIQYVLCNMAFNNGTEGLRKYKRFLHYINLHLYSEAADEIVDSDNYRRKDLHSRYDRLQAMVRQS